jgi:hypothetical protein
MKHPALVLFLLLSVSCFGQKIKYKDLFALLNARQYNDAEPFLRRYLKENDDNPNAFLQMGFIFQDKSQKSDVLKETQAAKTFADSAAIYYDKALKLITEKELKRNNEYYDSYTRRDLRTGEFSIKLSDVQLDIEKRIQEMKARSLKVGVLRQQFDKAIALYAASQAVYKQLQEGFSGEKELLLRSDESTLSRLKTVALTFDSTVTEFNSYKITLQSLGKTPYAQTVQLKEITNLKFDGAGTPDFFAADVPLWDFHKWAIGKMEAIENEVLPLRDKLVGYDVQINKLMDRVKRDSVTVFGEITEILEKLEDNPVKKFDPEPMPLELFRMKLAELQYASIHISNRKQRDTSNLNLRLNALSQDLKAIRIVDSIATRLDARDIDQESLNYQHFVTNAYGTNDVLKSLIKTTKGYADHQRSRKQASVDHIRKSLEWLVIATDSIPLTRVANNPHIPLVIHPDHFTLGLKYGADSVAVGYFYTITPSRVPDVQVSFSLDKTTFVRRNLPVIKALAKEDDEAQMFFSLIYCETKTGDKFPATIARINRSGGLAWAANYKFEFPPSELILQPGSGELTVKITSPSGESKLVTIDKNGKQL